MLKEYKVIQVYFTIKDLMQFTGLSYYKVYSLIKVKNISYNKQNKIRISRRDVIKYFNIKL